MHNSFRCRLRFRLLKKLTINEPEHRFMVAEREVVLSPPVPDTLISSSEWLVMNVRGFSTELEAQTFGQRLKLSLDLSAAQCRLGIDTGVNLPTSAVYNTFRDSMLKETGVILRNNIHGVDVFIDDPAVLIFNLSGDVTITASPVQFLADVATFHPVIESTSQQVKDIILLLNFALMRPEPVAQIIFAVSAVEMLGQDEDWSDEQKQLLVELSKLAHDSDVGTEMERAEVANAIIKSIHKMTLRQGVLRLLAKLDLLHLKKDWDTLYKERSSLVHGLAPKPGENYSDLAGRTVTLCGQILLRAIALEFELARERADTYYPLQATVHP